MTKNPVNFYCVGGTMEPDDKSYVPRDTDRILYEYLAAGDFCYVLNPRQVGKSSLMIRVAQALKGDKIHVAIVDLQPISRSLSDEKWYYAVLKQIGSSLGLESELRDYWLQGRQVSEQTKSDIDLISPLERWIRALKEVILPKCPGRIVIFVDEIDSVRSYTQFSADEFFAAIRFLYNEQRLNSELKRLSFCLIGVATPSDLIRDTRVTPFNVGERIELRDFKESEAQRLAAHLGRDKETNAKLLQRVLYWTGGHPYLTQRFCSAVVAAPSVTDERGIDSLCQELFLSPDARGKDTNILFVRDRMLLKESAEREPRSESELVGLLSLYSRIHKGKHVTDDETNPLISILHLSGIVRTKDGLLKTRNRIYQDVFDKKWIEENMPGAQLKEQRAQYRRKLIGLSAAALAIITFLGALTGYAFTQKRKADSALMELGLTKENLDAIAKRLKEREAALSQAEELNRRQGGAIEKANEELAVKETQIKDQAKIANEKSMEAERQKAEAAHQQNVARQMTAKANEEAENSKRLLYDKKISQAETLYRAGDVDSMLSILNATKREPSSFEWNYLNHLNEGLVPFNLEREYIIDNLLFSPTGKYLVTRGSGPPISVWNPQTGEKTELGADDDIQDDDALDMAFSPNEKWFAACGAESGVFLWDTTVSPWKTNRLSLSSGRDPADTEGCRFVSFNWNNKVLLTVSERQHGLFILRRWDVQTKTELREPKTISPGKNLKVHGFARNGYLLVTYDLPDPETPEESVRYTSTLDEFSSPYGLHREFPNESPMYAFSSAGDTAWYRKSQGIRAKGVVLDDSNPSSEWFKMVFSPDGKYLAALNDKGVRIWDTESHKVVRVIPLKRGIAKSIAFAPDNLRLAVGGYDEDESKPSILALWDIRYQGDVFTFNDEYPLATSSDGLKVIAQNKKGELNLWDTLKMEPFKIAIASVDGNYEAKFSPDGNHFALKVIPVTNSGVKPSLQLWNNAARAKVDLRSSTECQFPRAMNFSPDSNWLLNICADNTLRIWSVENGSELYKLKMIPEAGKGFENMDLSLQSLQLLQEGEQLMVLGPFGETVAVWNLTTGLPQPLNVCGYRVVKFSPDGKWVVTVDDKGNYGLLNRKSKKCEEVPLVSDGDILGEMEFSKDSKLLAFLYNEGSQGQSANTFYVIKNLETMKDISLEVPTGADNGNGVQFSPSGRWVRIGNKYWDIRKEVVNTIFGCMENPTFSPDETRLMTSCESGVVTFWDLESGQEVLNIQAHKSSVQSMVLMPENKYLLTASDIEVKLWRARF